MPQLFVVTTRQHALTDWSPPTYAGISAALRGVQLPTDPPVTWVGAPRVTRRAVVGSGFDTYVTAVLSWPDPPPSGRRQDPRSIQTVFGPRIQAALNAVSSGWDTVAVSPYLDVNNGADLAWWSSGRAAQTRTRDAYPTLGGRVDADENPIGPDTRDVRPSTVAEAGRQIARDVGGAVGDVTREAAGGVGALLAALVAAGAALYFAPSVATAFGMHRAAKALRRNPAQAAVGEGARLLGCGCTHRPLRANPFARFRDFAACKLAAKRHGVRDPDAYCGAIKRRAEGTHR
ncbi:MAG TPA: hypothetical protein VHH11_14110 [Gammaproteobacteria bacterium]|nr:hypothetical protein [Gammaproteobacteria bacterium]